MLISIIIPCYNEKNTILKLLNKVKNQKINKQIIVIDDSSTDGTTNILKKNFKKKGFKLISHKKNLGKGAAIKSAKKYIKGDIVIIQDADLEYDPKDYRKLILPIIKKKTKVVYGSRVLNKKKYSNRNFSSKFRVFANYILTLISNFINSQKLTDAHTCYKVFDAKLFKKIKLQENDFSFCPEITTKVSNLKEKILEVPIKYKGRSYEKGKKIQFKDGFLALKTLFKHKYFNEIKNC